MSMRRSLSNVDHPAHYGGADNPYEAIKVIDAWGLGFALGNAVKYIARAGKKAGQPAEEDLAKAIWYLQHAREAVLLAPKVPDPLAVPAPASPPAPRPVQWHAEGHAFWKDAPAEAPSLCGMATRPFVWVSLPPGWHDVCHQCLRASQEG